MEDMLEEFRQVAWRDFLLFAWQDEAILAQFRQDTGIDLTERRSGIVAAIDEATGKRDHDVCAFVEWVTRNHWGIEEAPAAYRAELERTDQ